MVVAVGMRRRVRRIGDGKSIAEQGKVSQRARTPGQRGLPVGIQDR